MEVHDRGAEGKTIILTARDKLRAVPKSHRWLITDDLKAVIQDVPAYFARMAEQTTFPQMADWLHALLRENKWSLRLWCNGSPVFGSRTEFWWSSDTVTEAGIGLPSGAKTDHLPEPLAALFRLVGYVDWDGGVGDGRIFWPEEILLLRSDCIRREERIDLARTLAWSGHNGDYLFATADDRGGWIGMDGKVIARGTVTDAINWWFGTLLAGQTPTMDRFEEIHGRG